MQGAAKTECKRCGCEVPDSSGLDQSLRARVGAQARAERFVASMLMLAAEPGWDLRDAKAIVCHLVSSPGECRKCRGPIEDAEVTECPRCRSLNLRW